MPNTLIPIQTYTLTGNAASVTFAGIPQNYTDLKVVVHARSDQGAIEALQLSVNNQGYQTNISSKLLDYGAGTARTSTAHVAGIVHGTNYTANTFGYSEIYIHNYTSGSNKPIQVTYVTANNATENYTGFSNLIWAQTAAITSLTFARVTTGNFVSGSTFTLYGVSNGVKATGGTLICTGGYAYHTFTSTASFTPSQQIKGAEFLVVAGGGGGGLNLGGGGGAGGLLYATSQTLNAGQTYTALVGAGGAGGVLGGAAAVNGSNSVISSMSAIGGGAGGDSGTGSSSLVPLRGKAGGSGGGATGYYYEGQVSGGTATQGNGLNFIGYGNSGGVGEGTTAGQYGAAASGGGGGAGATGAGATRSWVGGKGGDGTAAFSSWNAITGTGELVNGSYYLAGGGGGSGASGTTRALGGYGGGGAGGLDGGTDSTAGTANTGGGGGGSRGNNTNGKAGGSGLIIIRYPLA